MGSSESKPAPRQASPPRQASRPPTPPKLLTDRPWRVAATDGFTESYERKLIEQMKDEFSDDGGIKRANIILLGPIKAGKSSFLNTVASICKGRIADAARAGEAETSFTIKYGKFAPSRGMMKNFCMYDCMGLELEGHGFNVDDAYFLVKGHVPKNYTFNPISPITPDTLGFISNPKEEDKIHCVVYVIDAEALNSDIPTALKKRIYELQKKLNDLGMQRVMILTKIDKLCPKVDEDLANVYRSVKVRDIVNKASEIFQLPQNLIFPVKNYSSEIEVDCKLNILILHALRKMLNLAEDYLEQQMD